MTKTTVRKLALWVLAIAALGCFAHDYAGTRAAARAAAQWKPDRAHIFGAGVPDPISDVDDFSSPVQAPGTGEQANNATFKRALQQLANRTYFLSLHKADSAGSGGTASTAYVDDRVRTARVTAKSHSNSPYTIVSTDEIVEINTATGNFQANLPNPTGGRALLFADVGLSAASNFITLHRFGSEKIQGVTADLVLSTSGGTWFVWSNGTNWWVSGPL